MPRRLQAPPLGKYRVICPYCDKQWVTEVNSNPHEIQCDCGKKTNILVATVRGKHSRKHDVYREYHVRVVIGEGEREISFIDNPRYDIPMRSSDLVIFYYSILPRKIILQVHNITIKQYWQTSGRIYPFQRLAIDVELTFMSTYGYDYYTYTSVLLRCEKDAELAKWVDTQLGEKFDI